MCSCCKFECQIEFGPEHDIIGTVRSRRSSEVASYPAFQPPRFQAIKIWGLERLGMRLVQKHFGSQFLMKSP